MHPLFKQLQAVERTGVIEQHIGLKLVANGPPQTFVGEVCDILDHQQKFVMQAEVLGFEQGKVYLMPYDSIPVAMGYQVKATNSRLTIALGSALLGHIIDAYGNSINNNSVPFCRETLPTHNQAINALDRMPITERLVTGVHAIDGLLPIGKGQRIGIFAGSGVGKSMLLGKILRHSDNEIHVIALIGERGREVNDLINHLDESTLKKSIIVAACSDDSAIRRRQALFTATTIAEYFCQQGKDVLLLVDSITRFAMAQREIGLSLGEPPTARGYTPSVFSLLPGIVERAGNFKNQGSISAIYTVLVEGDDFNEPIADHMRSLLDGHIVLTRELAQRGHYPAISIVKSISRLAKQLSSVKEHSIIQRIFAQLSLFEQNRELIELGAYKEGTNLSLDKAVQSIHPIHQLLCQNDEQPLGFQELLSRFEEILA